MRRLVASLALMLPAAIPYLAHLLDHRPESLPTGYIQQDMPIYMAKAREAFKDGGFHLFYANPSDGLGDRPRIYFQPWTFALGLIQRVTGCPPGVLWVAFWFVSAWAASRVFLAVYEEFVGLETRSKRLGLVAFFWGGGVMAIAGIVRAIVLGRGPTWDDLTAFDPFRGWWFLNLGRNLVYPTEALYHALAFGGILCATRIFRGDRQSKVFLMHILVALTAACSPFAGLEVLAILWTASVVEMIASPRRYIAYLIWLMMTNLCTISALYYLAYLNCFPEHWAIAERMALPWRYSWGTVPTAYGIVFALAAWRFRTKARARIMLADPMNRLLIVWAVTAFALENHDLVVSPHQPIHFTRGYVWSALFLLGAPTLISIFDRLGRPSRLLLLGFLLVDNATWFATFAHDYGVPDRNGVRLSSEALEIVRRLDGDDFRGHILISEDERISYLALAETRLRTVLGHPLETPHYERRRIEVDALLARGRFAAAWGGYPLVVVRYRQLGLPDWVEANGGHLVFANRKFQILQFAADRPSRKL